MARPKDMAYSVGKMHCLHLDKMNITNLKATCKPETLAWVDKQQIVLPDQGIYKNLFYRRFEALFSMVLENGGTVNQARLVCEVAYRQLYEMHWSKMDHRFKEN